MADDGSQGGNPARNSILAATSFLSGANAVWLEQQYANFTENPDSVEPELRDFFAGLGDAGFDVEKAAKGPSWARDDWPPRLGDDLTAAFDGNWDKVEDQISKKLQKRKPDLSDEALRQAKRDSIRALMLIRAYRINGHLIADLDPLNLAPKEVHQELELESYGFSEKDMDREIFIDHVLGLESATLGEILEILKKTYCGTFTVEFMHITSPVQKKWIQKRIEGPGKEITFTRAGRLAILKKLIEAEGFEKFLQVKYTGTKRFGLDGAESTVPALEQIIKRGGALGVEDMIIGMPHRGRLNILAAVMGKPYHHIFHEFQGGSVTPDDVAGSGDVKYHLGASSDRKFDDNEVHLSLAPNPSHLEAVDPVVLGKARAKQDQIFPHAVPNHPRKQVLPLLLHGDAAFAGQGVVAECFGFTGLPGYRTSGTIHFIINNQIGFTTSPKYARSSPYPSDVAKMVEAPIIHVNGDDPEAVVHAARIAIEFRMEFETDVVIDMFCYRRFGHNEGDEPSFTQPLMYKRIAKQPSTMEIYANRLIKLGDVDRAGVDSEVTAFKNFLETEFLAGEDFEASKADWLDGEWSGLSGKGDLNNRGDTASSIETLTEIGHKISSYPDDFTAHRTLDRVLKARRKVIDTGANIDWATAEALAFGSLLKEGYRVRLSGQDCSRGTFSQRHASFVDQNTEERYTPLSHLEDKQPVFEVIDSNLSEFAVMGFEYGYSMTNPNALVLWEAQFGDFANGAQVIIDQFISSGERKWLRMSSLVLLLPHGYEGQGPEHSSARLERFLQSCAQDNMIIANCTTPANYFHILRRQMKRDFRKPLILMTPKSLLRHKRAVSTLKEMGPGSSFHRVLWDCAEHQPGSTVELVPDSKIKRVVICSGKVYFDLLEEREKRGVNDIYLLRVEQFYPYPAHSMIAELKRFKNADMVWCQEEPKNMGAWFFMEPNLEWTLGQISAKHKRARYVGRPASASPATGLMRRHLRELAEFLDDALTL
jgi:2-oxoglutarate dehydrogenase E1 component